MNSTIRFLKPNRYGRQPGSLDSNLGYGVHDALVMRGIAEFVLDSAPATAEEIPQVEIDSQETERPRRRRKQEET